MKIALTGSTGLIGSRITELLKNEFEFIHILQSEIDITNKEQIQNKIQNIDFDILLHLAAYTNVDGAETQKNLVYDINVNGTKNVFEAVQSKEKKFIYISTDFVFDGTKQAYDEDSIPNPLGYYAQTKYEGERLVKNMAMIVRLAYPYRARYELKKDFVRTIVSFLEQKKELQMVIDSSITPTFIDDIVYSLRYLFNHFDEKIYHLVGASSVSPYDASVMIANTFSLDKNQIKQTTFAEYSKNKAPRPQYSEIKTKYQDIFHMKTFEQGLAEVKKQIEK